MERIARSPRNFSLGRDGIGLVIGGKTGGRRGAGASWDSSLLRHGVRLVIGGKAWVSGVSGSPWDGGLSGHSI